MKKLAIGLAVVLALVAIGLVVTAIRLLDPVAWKPELVSRVRQLTGRELRIDGQMSLSLFPRIEFVADDVGLANAPGAEPADMITLDTLRLALRLRPLFSGKVEVESFVLERPTIALQVDAKGRSNWEFGPDSGERPGAGRDGAASLQDLQLDEARIVAGRVSWNDRRSGATQTFTEVNLDVSLEGFDHPLEMEGDFEWRERKIEVAVAMADPRAFTESGTTSLTVRLEAPNVRLRVEDAKAHRAPLRLEGSVALDIQSVRDVASWCGKPMNADTATFGTLAIRGDATVTASKLGLRKADIRLDDTRTNGDLDIDFAATPPRIEGSLAIERLDLNPYLSSQDSPPAGGTNEAWSDEPIAVDGMRAIDAAVELSLGSLDVPGFRLGRTAARARLAAGRLSADLTEVALYGGAGTASVTLDGSQAGRASLDVSCDLSGLRSDSLLRDLAGFDRLTGTAQVRASLSTRGRSSRELVGALGGTARVELRDGTLRGVNLIGMVTHVTGAFGRSDAAKTDFSVLGGSFRLAGGIARTDDLVLRSPLLHAEGAGSIDLPNRSLDLRVAPKFVAPAVGQLGLGSPGVSVPVLIRGPWGNPMYLPDVAGMVRGGLEVPGDVLKGVLDLPGNLLGGKLAPPPPKEPDPSKKNDSFFGGLFGR